MRTTLEKDVIMGISIEEIEHFKDLAVQFSKKTLSPMFEGEYSDGNLDMLPDILNTAFEIGLASSPNAAMAGSEYGIWGKLTDSGGMISSIELLMILAETCGGTAMCLHTQGVASNLLLCADKELPSNPTKAALCFQEGIKPPYCGTIFSPDEDLPASIISTAVSTKDGYEINGTKSFVYSMENPDVYVVLARIDNEWGCFAVPAETRGVSVQDAGHRTGLRACSVNHVNFNSVTVPADHRVDNGNALQLIIRAMCLNWIGMSSIAVGIAKGAVIKAKAYAADRYQGGCQIEEHLAIKLLIGGSEAKAIAADYIVRQFENIDFSSTESLGACAAAKTICMELSAGAATDTLQSFGGYGYMEDFGMEKKLRDVTVLKSAAGSPDYLKQLIFDLGKRENLK